MTRLVTKFWVHAYIKRLELQNIPAYVIAHGDNTAGAVLVKVAKLDGQARLMHRSYDLQNGDLSWNELSSGIESDVDALIAKQRSFDPDLWVIEVESSSGKDLLGKD